eukprot:2688591-Rhodomonas_salina.1
MRLLVFDFAAFPSPAASRSSIFDADSLRGGQVQAQKIARVAGTGSIPRAFAVLAPLSQHCRVRSRTAMSVAESGILCHATCALAGEVRVLFLHAGLLFVAVGASGILEQVPVRCEIKHNSAPFPACYLHGGCGLLYASS